MKILLAQLENSLPEINFLKANLEKIFKMELSVHQQVLQIPQELFNTKKHKWDAAKLLNELKKSFSGTREGEFMVLALFPYDIYAGGFNFIYGLAEKDGNFAVVSFFRLDPRFYAEHRDEKLFRTRLLKEAVHEIGHMMGLEHCSNKKCVMSFSPNIIFVDRKTAEFCKRCAFVLF